MDLTALAARVSICGEHGGFTSLLLFACQLTGNMTPYEIRLLADINDDYHLTINKHEKLVELSCDSALKDQFDHNDRKKFCPCFDKQYFALHRYPRERVCGRTGEK